MVVVVTSGEELGGGGRGRAMNESKTIERNDEEAEDLNELGRDRRGSMERREARVSENQHDASIEANERQARGEREARGALSAILDRASSSSSASSAASSMLLKSDERICQSDFDSRQRVQQSVMLGRRRARGDEVEAEEEEDREKGGVERHASPSICDRMPDDGNERDCFLHSLNILDDWDSKSLSSGSHIASNNSFTKIFDMNDCSNLKLASTDSQNGMKGKNLSGIFCEHLSIAHSRDFSSIFICSECQINMCMTCNNSHSCSLSLVSSIPFDKYLQDFSTRYSQYFSFLLENSNDATPNPPSSILTPPSTPENKVTSEDENPGSNETTILPQNNHPTIQNNERLNRNLEVYKLVMEHVENTVEHFINQINTFKSEILGDLYNKANGRATSNSLQNFSKLQNSARIIRQASEGVSCASSNTSHTAYASDESPKENLPSLFEICEAMDVWHQHFTSLELDKVLNAELDVTQECQGFEEAFRRRLINLTNSEIIQSQFGNCNASHYGLANRANSQLSPCSLIKYMKLPSSIDMSLTEYANTSFGQIALPPGMSPINQTPTATSLILNNHNNAFNHFAHQTIPNTNLSNHSLNHKSDTTLPTNAFPPHSIKYCDIFDPSKHSHSGLNSLITHSPPNPPTNTTIPPSHSTIELKSIDHPSDLLTSNLDLLNMRNDINNPSHHRKTLMQIKKKFGELGPAVGQFNSPHGFCLDNSGNILIADTNNHRVLFFSREGNLVHYFGNVGKTDGLLWYPRKIAVMKKNLIVVCDRGMDRSRMQIFTTDGQFIRQIPISTIDIVASIAIKEGPGDSCQIVVVDSVSPRVYVISETGQAMHKFDCANYMNEPSDLAIYNDHFYICDFKGHKIVVFTASGEYVTQFGGENITNFPNGIDVLPNGNILVGDSHGNRFHVVVYNQQFVQISEFECPFVKVSRCCGLKVTPDGCIVTLAKNNHHVLILNQILYTIDSVPHSTTTTSSTTTNTTNDSSATNTITPPTSTTLRNAQTHHQFVAPNLECGMNEVQQQQQQSMGVESELQLDRQIPMPPFLPTTTSSSSQSFLSKKPLPSSAATAAAAKALLQPLNYQYTTEDLNPSSIYKKLNQKVN